MALNKDHIVIYSFSVCIFLKIFRATVARTAIIPPALATHRQQVYTRKEIWPTCVPPGDGFRHAITGGMDIIVVIGVGDGIKVGVF